MSLNHTAVVHALRCGLGRDSYHALSPHGLFSMVDVSGCVAMDRIWRSVIDTFDWDYGGRNGQMDGANGLGPVWMDFTTGWRQLGVLEGGNFRIEFRAREKTDRRCAPS
ncbi:unnamed protein product [Cuscuta europaea]|uniref:Uncharacterized protein n=1 Tax=Cuscuta europaea TaxID=41803 RepID=A0A9P1DWD5_CUSEU|nr:unnamed protein product [Cuscuta europaea]